MTMGRTAAKQGRDPIVLLHFHATVCKVPQQTNKTLTINNSFPLLSNTLYTLFLMQNIPFRMCKTRVSVTIIHPASPYFTAFEPFYSKSCRGRRIISLSYRFSLFYQGLDTFFIFICRHNICIFWHIYTGKRCKVRCNYFSFTP